MIELPASHALSIEEGVPGSDVNDDSVELHDDLLERREAEMSLIKRFDATGKAPRKECWYLIDAKWHAQWMAFISRRGPPPGPISNFNIMNVDGTPQPKPGLTPLVHYRGVNVRVWCIFVEMYGASPPSPIQRWVVDIYQPVVSASKVADSVRLSQLKAKTLVMDMYAELNDADDDLQRKRIRGESKSACWRMFVCCLCCCKGMFWDERSAYERVWGEDSSSEEDDYEDGDHGDDAQLLLSPERNQ